MKKESVNDDDAEDDDDREDDDTTKLAPFNSYGYISKLGSLSGSFF